MFLQAQVDYIVGKDFADPVKIDESLQLIGLKEKYFSEIDHSLGNDIYVKFLSSLPPEAIFCKKFEYKNEKTQIIDYVISIPFISSHLGLPVKEKEIIWVYKVSNDNEDSYSIDHCYLGRAHCMLPVEDTSYSFKLREKKEFNIRNTEISDNILNFSGDTLSRINQIDYMGNTNNLVRQIYKDDVEGNPENFHINEKIKSYGIKPAHRKIKKPTDMSLQGSHNTCINMTNIDKSIYKNYSESENNYNESGKIEIVAGIKERSKNLQNPSEIKYRVIDNEDFITDDSLSIFTYENCGSEVFNGLFFEKVKSKNIFQKKDLLVKDEIYECFTEIYPVNQDLSKIVVSSKSIECHEIEKNSKISLKDINPTSKLIKFSSNIMNIDKSFNLLVPDRVENFYNKNKKENASIFGQSDNIKFCTHNTIAGEISLLKTVSLDSKPSAIKITNKGNILLDGYKILIGSSERSTNTKNGGEALVFIGESQNSQSLVLGEQLKEYLLETLDVQRESMHKIKELFNKSKEVQKENNKILVDSFKAKNSLYKNEVDAKFKPIITGLKSNPNPIVGSVLGVIVENIIDSCSTKISELLISSLDDSLIKQNEKINDFEENIINVLIKREEQLSLRLEFIENRIDNILSKFAKTS